MPASSPDRRFGRALLAVVLVAAVLRITYVLAVTRHDVDLYDATWYELQARSITAGDGFFHDPFALLADPDDHQPAADHAPLTVGLLLPAGLVDGEGGRLLMRFTVVLVGLGVVVATGWLGCRTAGPAVGLVAASAAAIDPNLWMNDGLLMPEAPATLLVVLAAAAASEARRRVGATRPLVLLGALVGLAGLARAELLALGPVLMVPALVALPGWRARLGAAALSGGVALAVVAPWVVANLVRFEEPVTISSNVGVALRAANCDATYAGPRLGYADLLPPCTPARDGAEQSIYDRRLRDDALTYIGDNLDRLPVVAAARVGRAWNVFRPGQTADFASGEGRPTWASGLGAVATWVVVPLAAAGAVRRRRRGTPVWELVSPVVVVTAVVAVASAGLVRYRSPVEPLLLVLAASAVVAALDRRRAAPP